MPAVNQAIGASRRKRRVSASGGGHGRADCDDPLPGGVRGNAAAASLLLHGRLICGRGSLSLLPVARFPRGTTWRVALENGPYPMAGRRGIRARVHATAPRQQRANQQHAPDPHLSPPRASGRPCRRVRPDTAARYPSAPRSAAPRSQRWSVRRSGSPRYPAATSAGVPTAASTALCASIGPGRAGQRGTGAARRCWPERAVA